MRIALVAALGAVFVAFVASLLYVQYTQTGVCLEETKLLELEPHGCAPTRAPRLVVISFDGFRADYLDSEMTPQMQQIRKEGVSGHMVPTFCTKTFPNHHSMATGLYQETHGIVHNNKYIYDPELGAFLNDTEDGTWDHWWDNGKATPIYIANQLAGGQRASCCAPWIGCHVRYEVEGQQRVHYHRHFNRSDQWEEQFEWAAHRMTKAHSPANLVLLYIPEPDMTAHVDGPFGEDTLARVRQVDQFVGYVRQRLHQLGLGSSTNLLFVSDHGVAEIDSKRMLVLERLLNSTWYDVYGCSPVLHLKPHSGFERAVAKTLAIAQGPWGHMRVYRKDSMPARLHYRNNRRIHEFVLVADEGWTLHATQAQADAERHHRGQHGYDNLANSMQPLFLASGPAFKRGYQHPTRFDNVDLYPLMLHLLGIEVNRHFHEGNFTNVAPMLAS